MTAEEIAKHPRGQKFRLLCGDREPMVEGALLDLSPDQRASGLEPQDWYGEGALGAAYIQFWERGRWVDL